MFQREKHHTNSEPESIRTVSRQCRLSMSYKAIDLEDTHLSSFSCNQSLFFKLTNTEKNLHYHSACQSILELLRHAVLELKQRVISGLVYFLANVVTALLRAATLCWKLIKLPSKAVVSWTRLMPGIRWRLQDWAVLHAVPSTNMLFEAWTRCIDSVLTRSELKLSMHLGGCLLNKGCFLATLCLATQWMYRLIAVPIGSRSLLT